jgi:hypothetical protein
MKLSIPEPGHRITLPHDPALNGTDDGFQQGQTQNQQIISFAREVGGTRRHVSIEVLYTTLDGRPISTEADYDAVLVDTTKGRILNTLPPYAEIDPEWEAKRNG